MPEVTISYIPDCPKHVRLAESGPVQPFAARLPEQPQAPGDHLLHIQGTRLRSGGSHVRFFLILLLTCLSAGAQEAPPDLLVDAGQCLGTAKQDWLDLTHRKSTTVELGFLERDQTAQVAPDSDKQTACAAAHPGGRE